MKSMHNTYEVNIPDVLVPIEKPYMPPDDTVCADYCLYYTYNNVTQ